MRKTDIFMWTAAMALAVGAGDIVSLGTLQAATAQPAQSQPQIDGVWLIEKPVFALRTADGSEPPLKPEAAEIYRARQAARAKGDTSFDSATWCSSLGIPRLLLVNYPFEIIARPKQVAFLHEWDWWARIAYLPGGLDKDATAPPPPGIGGPPGGPPGAPPGGPPPGGPPGGPGGPGGDTGPQEIEHVPTGFSQARWEGDMLIIETDHLVERTLLDSAGMPHSSNLKLTERIRLVSPDVMENRIRFDDNDTFTHPWETVVTYRRQAKASRYEDVCLDRLQAGEPAVKE